ncbi:hypothetical protein BKI52_45110 [marine bacterium AO1-C]|nr:hypothetical protein BKI52_45110 [marine bacterium AO1-C]
MNTELETHAKELWQIYPRVKKGAPIEKFWRKYTRAVELSRTQTSPKNISRAKPFVPDIDAAYLQLPNHKFLFYKRESPFPTNLILVLQSAYYSFFLTGFVHVLLGLAHYYWWVHLAVWVACLIVLLRSEGENNEVILKLNFELLPDAFLINNTSKVKYKNIINLKITRKRLKVITQNPVLKHLKKTHEFSLYNKNGGGYGRSDLDNLTNFLTLVIQRNALRA